MIYIYIMFRIVNKNFDRAKEKERKKISYVPVGIVQESIGTIHGDVQAESFSALVHGRGDG